MSTQPRPGQRFGRFELLRQLGRGGMGTVFLARDPEAKRDVALKVLGGNLDARQRERFRREGELTAALRHPGIVGIHAAGDVDGRPFLAYELVEGSTLEEALAQSERPRRVDLVRQVAEALGYAHAQSVVHRDVKPENVLIDADGNPRIADFGLAWVPDHERLTQTHGMVGTPWYMAPEQYAGTISPACDVWSLGVILYQALTGALPFDGSNMAELATQIGHVEPTPPRSLVSDVSRDLEAICLRALEKDAALRYPDAGAMARELENAQSGKRVQASSEQARFAGLVRRRRRTLLLGAPLALALCGVALALTIGARKASVEEHLSRALSAYQVDKAGAEVLAQVLGESKGCSAELRGRVHKALASSELPATTRLEHARQAAALATTAPARADAEALGAAALTELSRHAEAAEALGRALEAVPNPKRRRWRAAAYLRAGEPKRALELLGDSEDPESLNLRVHSLIADGRSAEAQRAVDALTKSHPPGQRIQLLKGALLAAQGGDPEPTYRAATARWPSDPAGWVSLARHLFVVQKERLCALVVLDDAAARGALNPEGTRLREILGASESGGLEWAHVDDDLRRASAEWSISVAERDLAFATRTRLLPGEGGPSADERQARARSHFEIALAAAPSPSLRAQAHAGLAAVLGPGSPAGWEHVAAGLREARDLPALSLREGAGRVLRGDPQGALDALEPLPKDEDEAAYWRARALVDLNRPREAVDSLRLGQRSLEDPRSLQLLLLATGQSKLKIGDVLARLNWFESPRNEYVVELAEAVAKKSDLRSELQELEKVVGDFPLCDGARYELSKAYFGVGRLGRGIQEFVTALRRDSVLFGHDGTFHMREVCGLDLQSEGRLSGPLHDAGLKAIERPDADPLTRGFLCAAVAEHTGRLDEHEWIDLGIRDLGRHLEARPAEVLAWAARGFLRIRNRQFSRASRDLAVAGEAAPRCASVPFYRALLAGAQLRPEQEVVDALREAEELGYSIPDCGYVKLVYPELAPYVDKPMTRAVLEAK